MIVHETDKHLYVDGDVFEIVEEFPLGYSIWNIGSNMPDGYLPLCRPAWPHPFEGARNIDPESLKCMKMPEAQQILKVAHHGSTLKELKLFIAKNKNKKQFQNQIAEVEKVIPILEKFWI